MEQQIIISNPKIMMGQPVVSGTRITVDLILEKLSAGESFEQLLQAHLRLTKEGIHAAIDYAAKHHMPMG
jgi:uncharacterized protein (DUF433 family)